MYILCILYIYIMYIYRHIHIHMILIMNLPSDLESLKAQCTVLLLELGESKKNLMLTSGNFGMSDSMSSTNNRSLPCPKWDSPPALQAPASVPT